MTLKTVGELRAILSTFPNDNPVEVRVDCDDTTKNWDSFEIETIHSFIGHIPPKGCPIVIRLGNLVGSAWQADDDNGT